MKYKRHLLILAIIIMLFAGFLFIQPVKAVSLYFDDFESSFGNWSNVTGDICDWLRDSGGTPSSNTGPSIDHTLGTSSGYYLFVEVSSGYCYTSGNTAYLEGPNVDADAYAVTLTFWYHMYGADMGTLYVDVYDGSWHNGVWSKTGQQNTSSTDPFKTASVDLSAYTGTIKIRFRGVAAGGILARGDMAIDDVEITGEARCAANGGSCSVNEDCCSNHCQNSICCAAGQTCCSNDTHCPDSNINSCQYADNYCDTVTDHYCKSNTVTCGSGQATKDTASCSAASTSNYCNYTCDGSCRIGYYGCAGSGSTCEGTFSAYNNCGAGTACSGGVCDVANLCNSTWAYGSCTGDNCYNDEGVPYYCQGSCDNSNNCDYAINCGVVGSIVLATTTTSGFLVSSIFDTGVSEGASFHSLLWQGTLCSSCIVKFQLTSSNNQNGPWNYYGPTSASDYYSPNPGIAITLPRNDDAAHQNKRYIRYKVYLEPYNSQSPVIDDIMINWSP